MTSRAMEVVFVVCVVPSLSKGVLADSINYQKRVAIQAVAGDQLSLDALSADEKTPAGAPCDVSKAAKPGAACPIVHLTVTDMVVKDQLKTSHKGDYFEVSYAADTAKPQNVLKTIGHYSIDSVDSPFW